jgi:2-phosphosulfolactate phosphatase
VPGHVRSGSWLVQVLSSVSLQFAHGAPGPDDHARWPIPLRAARDCKVTKRAVRSRARKSARIRPRGSRHATLRLTSKRLRVLMTREEIVPQRLSGATAVVVDVFLATTTLLTILENGARQVFPVASVEEAEEARAKLDASSVLRGGEQDAARIDGYDRGPFPDEYPPETVVGRDVVFVTTNGTRAIADAAPAERVLLGCLRNAPAIARYLQGSGADSVYLICAGSAGRFTIEDFLGAATVLACMDTGGWLLNDGAWMALDFINRYRGRELEALKESRAGRWFFEHDRMDAFEFVGEIGARELVPLVRAGQLVSTPPPAAYQHLSRD